MSGILEFLDISDLLDNRDAVYSQSDRDSNDWISLCELWYQEFGAAPVTAGQLLEICKETRILMEIWAG